MKSIKKFMILVAAFCMMLSSLSFPKNIVAEETETEPHQYTEVEAPLLRWNIKCTLGGHEYNITISKDAEGNEVTTGLDELNAAYPDGIPATTPFDVAFDFNPSNVNFQEGDTLIYNIPDVLTITNPRTGSIFEDDGATVITDYAINSNGTILLTPNVEGGTNFKNGHIEFKAKIDKTKLPDDNVARIKIGDLEIDIPIKKDVVAVNKDYDVTKSVHRFSSSSTSNGTAEHVDDNGTYIIWKLTVTASKTNNTAITDLVIKDVVPDAYLQYIKMENGAPKIVFYSISNSSEDPAANLVLNPDTKQWEWHVSDYPARITDSNKTKTMYYKMYLVDGYNGQQIKNNAVYVDANGKTQTKTGTYQRATAVALDKYTIETPYIDENGHLCIKYSIFVPSSKTNTVNIYDAVVTDVMSISGVNILEVKDFKYWIKAGSDNWVRYENYTGKYKSSEYTTYPADKAAVYDPTTQTLTWGIDMIPVYTIDNKQLGGRSIDYTVVLDWDFGINEEGATTNLPVLTNTAKIQRTSGGTPATKSVRTNFTKKWISKVGHEVEDGTFPVDGVIEYTINLQDQYFIPGHYTVRDELGAGASYYDAGEDYPRSVTLYASNVAGEFAYLQFPIADMTPVTKNNGDVEYTYTVTDAGIDYTFTMTKHPNGTSEFNIDLPESRYTNYSVEYYVVPDKRGTLQDLDVINTAGVGIVGPSPEVVYHEVTSKGSFSERAFIEKEALAIHPEDATVDWKLIVKSPIHATGAIVDTVDQSFAPFYYTQQQLNDMTLMLGDTEVDSDAYTATLAQDGRGFTITFNRTIEASEFTPLIVTVTGTVERLETMTQGDSITYQNDAELHNGQGLQASAYANITYTKKTHISKEYANFYVEDQKVYVDWAITINQEFDMEGNAVVTDLLPAGFKYISATKDTSASGNNSTTIVASSVVDHETGRDRVTINVSDLVNNNNGKVVIKVRTQVTSTELLTTNGIISAYNSAEINYKGVTESDDATVNVNNSVIDKDGIYNSGESEFIEYTTTINPNQLDLVPTPGISTIEVEDNYDPRTEFRRATFKITKADGTVIPESEHNLTVDPTNHKITFTIPDNEKVVITYKCFATGEVNPATNIDYTAINKVKFYGYDKSEVTDETDVNIEEVRVQLERVKSLTLKKRDASGANLPGAKFMLYEVTVVDGALVYTEADVEKTTDTTGTIKFLGFDNDGLNSKKVFAYKETEAPAGYYIPVEDAKYHIFAFESASITDAFKAAYLAENPDGDPDKDIVISTQAYYKDVYNYKGQVEVTKTFAGLNNVSGVFYFGLFDTDQQTLLQTGSINVVNGVAQNVLTFRNVDFGTNANGELDGSAKTYYVYETDVQGNKLEKVDGKVTINGMTYAVTGDGSVTISATDNGAKGTMTIENKGETTTDISITKKFTGGSLTDNTFSFVLEGVAGTNTDGVAVTAETNENGYVNFGTFTYTTAGEYKYTIKEIIPTAAVNNVLNGITYDTTVVDVTVKVAIDSTGKYKATATYSGEFENKYTTGGIKVTKVVTGNYSELVTNEFTFTATVTNWTVADGTYGDVTFANNVATFTLTKGQTATITGLPNGAVVEITETSKVAGTTPKTLTVTETISDKQMVEVNYENITNFMQLSVKKVWDDNQNQDNARPSQLTVGLKANNEDTGLSVVLNQDNNWTDSLVVPALDADGNTISYSWSEKDLPAGYYLSNTDQTATITTLTNKHDPLVVNVPVEKIWKDDSNKLSNRPESITVVLVKNGNDTDQTVELNSENGWKNQFTGLPAFENGQEIVYTVKEVEVKAYTSVVTGNATDGFVITNTPTVTDIDVTKSWNDNDDNLQNRPEKITVVLVKNGNETDTTIELNANNRWKYHFTDLPTHENGTEIVYTVKEVEVTAYNSVVTGNAKDGFVITNTPTVTEINVSKTWNDENNKLGNRTSKITVVLVKNGTATNDTVELNATNNWTGKFDNLPTHQNGQQIVYTVEEVEVAGYTYQVSGNATDGYIITNTPAVTEVEVSKVWDDENDKLHNRPLTITVVLVKNGNDTDTTVELNENNNWAAKFENLPTHQNGTEIAYTVKEVEVTGYDSEISGNAVDGYVITNTPSVTEIEVTKQWDDNGNELENRPEKITVVLVKNGNETDTTIELNADNRWKYHFADLPTHENGEELVYSIKEVEVTGFDSEITGDAAEGFVITNTPSLTEVEVSKVWDDEEDKLQNRPLTITVVLVKNGDPTDITVELNEENDWTAKFIELPTHQKGTEIVYTVDEVEVTGYVSDITGNATDGFVITNTPSLTEIEVTKVWEDNEDEFLNRPESITVVLVKDGNETDITAELNEENDWTYKFEKLPTHENGEELVYTVVEVEVDSYANTVTGNAVDGYVITNTLKYIEIPVEKIWQGDESDETLRPESITVILLANGEEFDRVEIIPDEDGFWSTIFTDLPQYMNGELVEYTVDEEEVKSYSKDIEGSIEEGFIITNTYVPRLGAKDNSKLWAGSMATSLAGLLVALYLDKKNKEEDE